MEGTAELMFFALGAAANRTSGGVEDHRGAMEGSLPELARNLFEQVQRDDE